MRNRVLLTLVVVFVVAGLVIAGCAPQAAPTTPTTTEPTTTPTEEVIELRFGHWIPLVSAYHTDAFVPWVEKIEERTNGRVKITIYGQESIGKMFDLYDLTATGAVDISMFAMAPRWPQADVSALPFLFPSAAVASCSMQEITEKYLQQADFKDVKCLYMFTNSPYHLFTRSSQVKTLADLKGRKLYGSGSPLYAQEVEALGPTLVSMSGPEAYTAMQGGVVDGCFLNIEGQWIWKYALATKYRTILPDSLTLYLMGVIMNWDAWNSLPPDIQTIFEEEGGVKWAYIAGNAMDQADIVSKEAILEYDAKEGNPPWYYLPEDEFAKWKKAEEPITQAWIDDMKANGLPGQELYDDAVKLATKYKELYPPPPPPTE